MDKCVSLVVSTSKGTLDDTTMGLWWVVVGGCRGMFVTMGTVLVYDTRG